MTQRCKINFVLVFSILILFLGASCKPKSGGSDTPLFDFTADNDGDGIIYGCDDDDSDASNTKFTTTDSDGNPGGCDADADGLLDGSCMLYDADDNEMLSESEYSTAGVNCDNCIGIASTSGKNDSDEDGDGFGASCDTCSLSYSEDPDGDCVTTTLDNCPSKYNSDQDDSDGDGEGDKCDDTTDADGDTYNVADSDDTKVDCDDTNASVHPGASGDVFGDDVDTDCDGSDFPSDTSKIIWVYPGYSPSSDPTGTFNNPYGSLDDAVEDAEDDGIANIYVYTGTSSTVEEVRINKAMVIMGGFHCVNVNSDGTEDAIDDVVSLLSDCTSLSQIRHKEVEKLDDIKSADSQFAGNITIEHDDVTLQQISVVYDSESDADAALVIKNSSPTVKNGFFHAPYNQLNEKSQTVAIRIESSGSTTDPTLKENIILAGTAEAGDDDSDGDGTDIAGVAIGVKIYSDTGITNSLAPTIDDNSIEVGQATYGAAIYLERKSLSTSTSLPSIKQNTIQVDKLQGSATATYKLTHIGVASIGSAMVIEKNKISVQGGASSYKTWIVYGVHIANPIDTGAGSVSATSQIYTNLIEVNVDSDSTYVRGLYLGNKVDVYSNTIVYGKALSYRLDYNGAINVDSSATGIEINVISNIFATEGSGYAYVFPNGNDEIKSIKYNLFQDSYESTIFGSGAHIMLSNVNSLDEDGYFDGESEENIVASDLLLDEDYVPEDESPAINAGYNFYPDRGSFYDDLPSTIPAPEFGSLPSGKVPSGSAGGTSTAEFDYSDYLPSLMTDIDGHIRPKGDGVDIGCYEVE